MSGGHYDYQCFRIGELADNILQDCDKFTTGGTDRHGWEYSALPEDILAGMRDVAEKLNKLSQIAHDIEWYMSGDYGDETMRECFRKFKEGV